MHVVEPAGRSCPAKPRPLSKLHIPKHFRTLHQLGCYVVLNMPDYTKYYVAGAFLTGIAVTTAYNRHLTASSGNDKSQDGQKQQHKLLSRLSKINDLAALKKTLVELESSLAKGEGGGDIKEGIEGCIGDTPLIRIKSLSEYTGCDILVKAEVGSGYCCDLNFGRLTYKQFLNGAGNSPKDRVALSIIEMARTDPPSTSM